MKILLGIVSISTYFVLLNYFKSHSKDKSHTMSYFMRYPTKQVGTDTKILSSRLIKIINDFSLLNYKGFQRELIKHSTNNTIILSFVDMAFSEMAINLYFSSIKYLEIDNYLFVCSSHKVAQVLELYNIKVVTLWNNSKPLGPSDFNTEEFGKKAIRKVIVSLLALELGYKVLFMDADIILFKNPFPYISCNQCDILFQPEQPHGDINSGFYFAFPTEQIKKLFSTVIERKDCWKYEEQHCLSITANELKIKKVLLPYQLFQSGLVFFNNGHRMFAFDNPCETCVLVHNNWIVSFSYKRYRFKELLMWHVDTDGYYSNNTAKYITYQNIKDFGALKTQNMESNALINAFVIGFLLNRIVILPKFSCYGCNKKHCQMKKLTISRCAAHVQYNIKKLDELFGRKYREHMFLNNTMVPRSVKESITEPIFIQSSHKFFRNVSVASNDKIFYARDTSNGATIQEFISWMLPFSNYSVIKFHSLYGQIINYKNYTVVEKIKKVLAAKRLFR